MVESLELFKEIVNSTWFADSAMILFMNKIDLFEQKYMEQGVPLNASGEFPDAPSGEPDLKLAYSWFEQKFKSQAEDASRTCYTYFTCATDTQTVDAVMKASSQHVLKLNLKGSGVLV